MITLLEGRLNKIDRAELLRYLSSPSQEGLERLLDECEGEVLAAQRLQAVYGVFNLTRGDMLDLSFAKVQSSSLERYLDGCDRFALFAATAGAGVDRLISRYSRLSPAKAAAVQAAGAALVEQWCDEVCRRIGESYAVKASRFSCGYGDLDICLQRDIFAALSVTKRLGVTLSDNFFMTPTKSVTAFLGITG